jgi:hypothetical protein
MIKTRTIARYGTLAGLVLASTALLMVVGLSLWHLVT